MADVAQLAEHQIVALGAVGSNPTVRPKTDFIKDRKQKNFRSFYFLGTLLMAQPGCKRGRALLLCLKFMLSLSLALIYRPWAAKGQLYCFSGLACRFLDSG